MGLVVSPAVPRGSHRAGQRSRWPVVGAVIVAVIAIGVAAWFLISKNPLRETADFSFEFGKVGGSAVADKAPEDDLQSAAEQVRETLDAMYVVGFVDNAKWKGGTFPELYDAFTDDLEAKVRHDLPNLSLGADAARIDTVDPISGRLSVRFLVDDQQQLIGATAHAIFAANAVATDGGNVAIQHDGTYYMEPVDGSWLINAYEVRGIVTPVAQPLPDPSATSS
jgi:hypothetical protein